MPCVLLVLLIYFAAIIGFQSMSLKLLVVLPVLALMCYNYNLAISKKHYISPKRDQNRSCKENHRCLILSQFANEYSTWYLESSTNLVLLPGMHYLKSDLIIADIHKFEMTSYSSNASIIVCDESRFTWTGVQHVLISGITFRGCGPNKIVSMEHFEIMNSTFIESVHGHKTLFVIHSNVTITNSTFIFNLTGNAPDQKDFFQGLHFSAQPSMGGALAITNKSNVVIRESRFEGNGAQFRGVTFVELSSNVTVANAGDGFENTASGAIIYADKSSIVTMNNAIISNNGAANTKGVIFLHNSSLNTYRCVYCNNFAGEGSVIYAYKSTLSITESTFTRNIAQENGGVLLLKHSIANIDDSIFMHNKAFNGGGIYSGPYSTLTVHRGNFTFNQATNDAGAVLGDQSVLTLVHVAFSDNRAKWAGAVAAYEKTDIIFKECKISHNRAKWGGALALYMGTITLKNSIADYQHATEQGGVVYVNGGMLMIENSSISNNEADVDGGAIIGVDAKLVINGTNFTNNHAKYYGSVLHWSRGAIKGSGDFLLESNTAEKGLMYLYESSTNFDGNISFIDNHALLYTINSHVSFSGRTTFPMLEINSGEAEKKKKAKSEGI